MKIALATDHTGVDQLRQLQSLLAADGHTTVWYGPAAFNADDDYPDFIISAAQAVAQGECDRAIIMGGSGQGEAMAANRVPGVRCAVFYGPAVPQGAIDADGQSSDDPYAIVRLSREHNDANVLSLAARFLTPEQLQRAVRIWLETPFTNADRHARRVQKLG